MRSYGKANVSLRVFPSDVKSTGIWEHPGIPVCGTEHAIDGVARLQSNAADRHLVDDMSRRRLDRAEPAYSLIDSRWQQRRSSRTIFSVSGWLLNA